MIKLRIIFYSIFAGSLALLAFSVKSCHEYKAEAKQTRKELIAEREQSQKKDAAITAKDRAISVLRNQTTQARQAREVLSRENPEVKDHLNTSIPCALRLPKRIDCDNDTR